MGEDAGGRLPEFLTEPVACSARALTLSARACAADWRRAQAVKPLPWLSLYHCRGCTLGAAHAGRPLAAAVQVTQLDEVRRLCVRCHQPARKILHGRYCVSCYNRDRELAAGKNGRGTEPSLLRERYPLHTVEIRYRPVNGGDWRHTRPVERAASALEAMLILLRRESSPLLFGRPVAHTASIQAHFWGGV